MVLVSFEYSVNQANVQLYRDLFKDLSNPNSCPPKATFYVQELNTDFAVVKELYDSGNEIGMTSSDGIIPPDAAGWLSTYTNMKQKITEAFIPGTAVQGTRGPELSSGGDDQYNAISEVGLSYDSTCASFEYSYKDNLLWPYTYDFTLNTPRCSIGRTPAAPHPGKWQFIVATVRAGGQNCASLSACSPFINSTQAAFNIIYDSFNEHYQGNKSPFVLYIDPLWLTVKEQFDGTRQFLQMITDTYNDTYFITTQQSLDWMKTPVTIAEAKNFQPWACS